MRINKKEISNVMNLLEIRIKNCYSFKEILSTVNETIPSIEHVNGDKETLTVKTNLIYDIHKNYMRDIRKMGIDISEIKTTALEFVIDHNLGKITILCNLRHILDDGEAIMCLSKKVVNDNTLKAVV